MTRNINRYLLDEEGQKAAERSGLKRLPRRLQKNIVVPFGVLRRFWFLWGPRKDGKQ